MLRLDQLPGLLCDLGTEHALHLLQHRHRRMHPLEGKSGTAQCTGHADLRRARVAELCDHRRELLEQHVLDRELHSMGCTHVSSWTLHTCHMGALANLSRSAET